MGKANEDVSSTISVEELEEIRKLAEFGEDTELIVPGEAERPENCPDDLVCFYAYPFTIGYTVEFSSLTKSFLHQFQLSPGQMMPNFWRICLQLELVTAEWDSCVDWEDILVHYSFKVSSTKKYTFSLRKRAKKLIYDQNAKDKGWNRKFFYVRKTSLGDLENYYRSGWNW